MTEQRWSEEERRLLADLVSGARDPADGEAARMLDRNVALRQEYLELRGIADRLDADAADRRDELAAARRDVGPDDLEVARRFLARHGTSRRFRRTRFALRIALAAAATAVLAWLVHLAVAGGSGPPREIPLGPEHDVPAAPEGVVPRFGPFTWRAELPEGGWFRVLVYAADAGRRSGDETVAKSADLDRSTWTPSPEQLRAMERAGEICWELIAVEADGTERSVRTVFARSAQ